MVERADQKRRLQELQERIIRNAVHQEGDSPSENPDELLEEFQRVALSLENLIVRINKTNNQISLDNGLSMIAALAQRDVLKLKHSLYKALAANATPGQNRYSQKEIRYISSVSVKEVQEQADAFAKAFRELDALIQQANWSHDLS
ncbi:MAG: DIP1984 family protein [Deinococcales bacterium]